MENHRYERHGGHDSCDITESPWQQHGRRGGATATGWAQLEKEKKKEKKEEEERKLLL